MKIIRILESHDITNHYQFQNNILFQKKYIASVCVIPPQYRVGNLLEAYLFNFLRLVLLVVCAFRKNIILGSI